MKTLLSINLMLVSLCLSSNSLLIIWLFMEMNIFFFAPLIYIYKSPLNSGLKLWKYFFVQSLSSLFIAYYVFVIEGSHLSDPSSWMLVIPLFMKMGIPPFHGWVFQISENMDWYTFFLINSMQKIIPIWILINSDSKTFLIFMISISMFYSLFLNVTSGFSIRWMLMVSSSMGSMWMIFSSVGFEVSLFYFCFNYFLSFYYFIFYISRFNASSLGSMVDQKIIKFNSLVGKILSIFYLLGIPPLGMFQGKFRVLWDLIFNEWDWYSFFIVLCNGFLTVMYIIFLISIYMSLEGDPVVRRCCPPIVDKHLIFIIVLSVFASLW